MKVGKIVVYERALLVLGAERGGDAVEAHVAGDDVKRRKLVFDEEYVGKSSSGEAFVFEQIDVVAKTPHVVTEEDAGRSFWHDFVTKPTTVTEVVVVADADFDFAEKNAQAVSLAAVASD